ncbi:hypothetical protein CIL05_02265 [Virgibacillus profundi]|uniref:Uncharacterized protein n=1 Tax=Virgibacillus profundi TaxID=2024555 RepID=A0A2A2IHN1_9BACI|nr:hypothetical protein [Virgibacillus profundi]PAV31501.1 hypothetical protein CIL05_02265 [Virgibacillus profundi]PXY55687.1 hypothetical protein CIT14_02275 [Virgibacillus profundi]
MNAKEEVIKLIKDLPDNVTMEDIIQELYIHIKFQQGVRELNDGKPLSPKTAKIKSGKWLH